jgi:dihydroneopterin aldolase
LAERIAEACFEDARVRSARVRVEKLHALPGAESAGVEIERQRSG